MKRFFVCSLFSFILVACDVSIPELPFDGLHGNVSMVRDSTFSVIEKNGEIVADSLTDLSVKKYDKKGHTIYYSSGLREEKSRYFNGERVSTTTIEGGIETWTERLICRKKNYSKWRERCETFIIEDSFTEIYYDGLNLKSISSNGNMSIECYDEEGHLIDAKFFTDDTLALCSHCEYNNGNEVRVVYMDSSDTTVFTLTYPVFDKEQNWTTQIAWSEGRPCNIIRREITYR